MNKLDEESDGPEVNGRRVTIAVLHTLLGTIGDKLDKFAEATEKRFQTVEHQFDDLSHKQSELGKPNWSAIAILLSVIGGAAFLYLAPIKTSQEAADARLYSSVSEIHKDLDKLEYNRQRDQDKFDDRLQREMKMLNEVTATKLQMEEQMSDWRFKIDEKRIDDVTLREDKRTEDDRAQLDSLLQQMRSKFLADHGQQDKN